MVALSLDSVPEKNVVAHSLLFPNVRSLMLLQDLYCYLGENINRGIGVRLFGYRPRAAVLVLDLPSQI